MISQNKQIHFRKDVSGVNYFKLNTDVFNRFSGHMANTKKRIMYMLFETLN